MVRNEEFSKISMTVFGFRIASVAAILSMSLYERPHRLRVRREAFMVLAGRFVLAAHRSGLRPDRR